MWSELKSLPSLAINDPVRISSSFFPQSSPWWSWRLIFNMVSLSDQGRHPRSLSVHRKENHPIGIELWHKHRINLYCFNLLVLINQLSYYLGRSVQFSCSVVSDSLRPCGLEHARLPCPSPTPRICSNLCPPSRWYHPTISSTVIPGR